MSFWSDGAGYVEDGREVFDDDLDDENVNQAKGGAKGINKKKNVKGPTGKSGNIKNIFLNMPSKSKEVWCLFKPSDWIFVSL